MAHREGALCGALPLLVERRRLSGVPARVLRALRCMPVRCARRLGTMLFFERNRNEGGVVATETE